MTINVHSVVPVIRIFDIAKADEFYLDFLGFAVDWDHRFENNMPLYRQISLGDLVLHLTEHHGDCSPGSHTRVMVDGLEDYQRELISKNYKYMRPGIEESFGGKEMCVVDPFGNQIKFCQK